MLDSPFTRRMRMTVLRHAHDASATGFEESRDEAADLRREPGGRLGGMHNRGLQSMTPRLWSRAPCCRGVMSRRAVRKANAAVRGTGVA